MLLLAIGGSWGLLHPSIGEPRVGGGGGSKCIALVQEGLCMFVLVLPCLAFSLCKDTMPTA